MELVATHDAVGGVVAGGGNQASTEAEVQICDVTDALSGSWDGWAAFPPELAARVVSYADDPHDICSGEAACRGWLSAGTDPRFGFDPWRALCAHWYPTMTARIAAAANDSSVEVERCASSKCGTGTTGGTTRAAGKATTCLACRAAPRKGRLRHSTFCAVARELAPSIPEDTHDEAIAILDDDGDAARAMLADGARQSWRAVFKRRFQRQQAWDAEKRRQKTRGDRASPVDANGSASTSTGSRVAGPRSQQRTRTCKRCGVDFAPHERGAAPCRFHSGRFVAMDENGVVGDACSASRDFNAKAQRIVKAHNRKKGSKKNCLVVFGNAYQSGVAREDGLCWRWTCCREENLVAPGCAEGLHT